MEEYNKMFWTNNIRKEGKELRLVEKDLMNYKFSQCFEGTIPPCEDGKKYKKNKNALAEHKAWMEYVKAKREEGLL